MQETVLELSARGGRIAAGGGLFAAGGGLFAGGPFTAGLIAGGLFASGLNAATRPDHTVILYHKNSNIIIVYAFQCHGTA